jgi:hypothetical protein
VFSKNQRCRYGKGVMVESVIETSPLLSLLKVGFFLPQIIAESAIQLSTGAPMPALEFVN